MDHLPQACLAHTCQAMRADIAKLDLRARILNGAFTHRFGHKDLRAMAGSGDPRGVIDDTPAVLCPATGLLADPYLAGMDTDSHPRLDRCLRAGRVRTRDFWRGPGVMEKRALRIHRPPDSIGRMVEDDHQ